MEKTGLHGYGYDFSFGYDAADVDNIVEFHKYLMSKNDIV